VAKANEECYAKNYLPAYYSSDLDFIDNRSIQRKKLAESTHAFDCSNSFDTQSSFNQVEAK